MSPERLALAVAMSACLCACALRPPPAPQAIDCESDRAAERYPETCGDAGEADSGDDQ